MACNSLVTESRRVIESCFFLQKFQCFWSVPNHTTTWPFRLWPVSKVRLFHLLLDHLIFCHVLPSSASPFLESRQSPASRRGVAGPYLRSALGVSTSELIDSVVPYFRIHSPTTGNFLSTSSRTESVTASLMGGLSALFSSRRKMVAL